MSDKSKLHLPSALSTDTLEAEARQVRLQRRVQFPTDRSLGLLWIRTHRVGEYSFWESWGEARGVVDIPAGKELRLNIPPHASADIAPLSALHADDVQYLQLSSTFVNDAALQHLRGLTGLRVLWLYDTRISDAGLVHLHGLKHLRVLNLRSTYVSPGGVDALQEILPQCEIRRAWK